MKKLLTKIILNIVCFTSFSQWRTYYPEEKTTKKNNKVTETKSVATKTKGKKGKKNLF